MIRKKTDNCPKCNGQLFYYDKAKRIVKTRYGRQIYIFVKRYKCSVCGSVHRCIPKFLIPYKHYELEIIKGVLEGIITNDILGFEDYPCEQTMKRWREIYNSLYERQ